MRKNLSCSPVKPFFENVACVDDVADAFGHFFAVNKEVGAVKPVSAERFAADGFGDGKGVVVVADQVVDSAAGNVDGEAQMFGHDGGVLNVPCWSAAANRGFVADTALFAAVPNDEVAHVPRRARVRVLVEATFLLGPFAHV